MKVGEEVLVRGRVTAETETSYRIDFGFGAPEPWVPKDRVSLAATGHAGVGAGGGDDEGYIHPDVLAQQSPEFQAEHAARQRTSEARNHRPETVAEFPIGATVSTCDSDDAGFAGMIGKVVERNPARYVWVVFEEDGQEIRHAFKPSELRIDAWPDEGQRMNEALPSVVERSDPLKCEGERLNHPTCSHCFEAGRAFERKHPHAVAAAAEEEEARTASEVERVYSAIEAWADKMYRRGVDKIYDTAARYHLGITIRDLLAQERKRP